MEKGNLGSSKRWLAEKSDMGFHPLLKPYSLNLKGGMNTTLKAGRRLSTPYRFPPLCLGNNAFPMLKRAEKNRARCSP